MDCNAESGAHPEVDLDSNAEISARSEAELDSDAEDSDFDSSNLDDSSGNINPDVECAQDCPLRSFQSSADPPLPLPQNSLVFTREEACARLYTSIKPWQTRLLQVQPGQFGTVIVASLHVIDITHLSGAVLHSEQQQIQFVALSYTWGAAKFPRKYHHR